MVRFVRLQPLTLSEAYTKIQILPSVRVSSLCIFFNDERVTPQALILAIVR